MGAPVWILLVSCLGLHCVQWSKMEASKQIHPQLKFRTFCNWTQSDTQHEVFFINYNQGREQSPWRFGKVNIKFTFSTLGHSVSSLCLPLIFTRWRRKQSVNKCQFLHCLLAVLPLEKGEERAHANALK